MFNRYLQITKPNIILGNLISTIGGFLLASKGSVKYICLLFVLIGVSLIIGSSCIFNNLIDIDIDKKMERTKNRPLVIGLISQEVALLYAILLGSFGFLFLGFFINSLAFLIGFVGFTVYVGIYSLYMKRHSVHGVLYGSLSGAMPPVLGYCSVTNKFDIGAFILLTIFSLWQIPHSYAISIFRFEDYQSAKIPVLPVMKGIPTAKRHIILYIVAFTIVSSMLSIFEYTGFKYLITTTILNLYWLHIACKRKIQDEKLLAKKIFLFSILIIVLLTIMISTDYTTTSHL